MKTNLLLQAGGRRPFGSLLLSVVVIAACWILSESAWAFSIASVTLAPTSPVPAGSNIVMTINIITPSAPPGLYQPTTVSVQGNRLLVDVYPTGGMLTVLGHLSTNVNLGVLPGGAYQYEVRLHPEFPVGWGVRTNQGSFIVLPTNPPPTNHPPFVNFYSPPDGATFSAPANIRLVAYAEDPEDGNNLTVEFFNGNLSLGFGTFVPSLCPTPFCPNYSLVWSNVPVGKYELTARVTDHQGATTNSGLVHVSVLAPPPTNQPPTVDIVSPADGATFTAPANIFFIASVHDPDGNVWVANVEFFEGTNKLGRGQLSDPGPPHDAPFRFYWTNVPAGRYTLTARATDDQGATGISPAINITVDPLPPTNPLPVVTIKAIDPIATEGTNCYRWSGWPTPLPASLRGTNTATFVVRRDGDTNASLTVYYQVSGTASNGLDYAELPGTLVIPAGQRMAPITIWPVDDVLPEKIETVVLGLYEPPFASPLPPPYSVGKPGRAAAIIVDNDQPRPCTGRLPDRCFHLMQPGTIGDWFRIECSTDLVHWTALCTNSVTDGAIHFVDPDADTASQRFYRAEPENGPPTD